MSIAIQRNKTLDVYKGALIILVVIRHVLQFSVSDEGGVLTNFIWAVQMPGFMLVAGYFSARKINNLRDVRSRIAASAKHYLLPFLSWFVVIQVIVLGKYDRNPIVGLAYIANHVDSALWFLWTIFVLSVFAAMINYFIGRKHGAIKIGIFCALSIGVLLAVGKACGFSFLGIQFVLVYSIYYGVGWTLKWTEQWWKPLWIRFSGAITFLALMIFLSIVFNVDLYRGEGISTWGCRYLAGFTGNLVLFILCKRYESSLSRIKLDWLGMYTLEIYATHMCVNNLMEMGQGFFTAAGFGNFVCSLILTVVFTTIIIATFKAIPTADFVFYGKRQK